MTSSFGIGGFGSAFNVYQLPGLSSLISAVATNALAQENFKNDVEHPGVLSHVAQRLLFTAATAGVGYGVWRTLESLKAAASDMATPGPEAHRYYSASEVTYPLIRDRLLEMALRVVPDSAPAQGAMGLALGAGLILGGYALARATHRQLLIEGLCRNLLDDRPNIRDESYELLIKLRVMDTVEAKLENLKATSTDSAQILKVQRALEEIRIAKLIAALLHDRSVDQMLEELAKLPEEDQGRVRQTVFDAHLRFATAHPWAVSEIVSFFAAFRTDDCDYGFDYMMDVLRTRHAELTPNLRRAMGTACVDIMVMSGMPLAEVGEALHVILNWEGGVVEHHHAGYVFAHWPISLGVAMAKTMMAPHAEQINNEGFYFGTEGLTPDVLANLKTILELDEPEAQWFVEPVLKGMLQSWIPLPEYLAFLEQIYNVGDGKFKPIVAKYYIEYLHSDPLPSPSSLSAIIRIEDVCSAPNIEFIIETPTLTPRTEPAQVSRDNCLTVRIPQHAESHLMDICNRQGFAFHIRVAAARALLENGSGRGTRYLPAWTKDNTLKAGDREQAKNALEAVGLGNSQGKDLATRALQHLKQDLKDLEERVAADPVKNVSAVVDLYQYFTYYDDEVAGAILRQLSVDNFISVAADSKLIWNPSEIQGPLSRDDALAALYILDQCGNTSVRDRINKVPIASFVKSEEEIEECEKTPWGRKDPPRSRNGLTILAYLGNKEARNHENVGSRELEPPFVRLGSESILSREDILKKRDDKEIARRKEIRREAERAAREQKIVEAIQSGRFRQDTLPPPPWEGGDSFQAVGANMTFLTRPRPVPVRRTKK